MLSNRPYFLAVRDGSKLDEHDPADWSEGDEVAEGEYWDPPCRVCKKVDNESNVLCDICNGAYHLGCLATLKGPPLPRTPEDDEWFCRACVKRGIPESIVDRVGRGSFAHYLVKWIGRSTHEVSWENADALDTPWCRKLITAYMESEKARGRQGMSLLPPSHPLVDRLQRAKVMPTDASGAGGTVRASGGGAKGSLLAPAPAELARMLDQVATLCQGCGAVEGGRHALGLLARETGELLQLHAHCAALEQCDEDTRAGAKASVSAATDALRSSHEALEAALGPAMEAAKAQAIQAQARAQAQLDAQRLATHKGTSYQGFLLYLREERPRIRAALPEVSSREIEKAAATEWKDLEPTRKRQCISRAAEVIGSNKAAREKAANADDDDDGAMDSPVSKAVGSSKAASSKAVDRGGGGGGDEKEKGRHRCGGGGGGGRRQPCDVCGTNDKRDFVECCECDARTHLMCFWPPWEAVSKGDKWRCSRCACTPPPPLHELAPAPGEAIEVEVGHLSEPPLEAWKPATVVRLKPGSGGSRFTAKVDLSGGGGKGGGGGGGGGGEDDDDVVEECAVSEHAREWRRPQATAERIDAEREARGAAAAANAALVAQLEGDLAADARPTPSELLPLVEELYRDGMVEQEGQSGRLGEAIAGLHGLIRLRLKAWGCPPHS